MRKSGYRVRHPAAGYASQVQGTQGTGYAQDHCSHVTLQVRKSGYRVRYPGCRVRRPGTGYARIVAGYAPFAPGYAVPRPSRCGTLWHPPAIGSDWGGRGSKNRDRATSEALCMAASRFLKFPILNSFAEFVAHRMKSVWRASL